MNIELFRSAPPPADTRARQERAIAILQFKLDILWSMLDVVERAYPDDLPMESRP